MDLDEEGRAVWDGAQAAGVVVLPTYMIDGAVISLGNPTPDELFARLARREAGH